MKRRSQHILRMLSFAMALVMVLGMFPAGARAEETVAEHVHTYERGVCTVDGCTESKLDEGWLEPNFPALEEGDYTMVLIPDTQHLVNSHEEGYYDLMQWIADNKEELNIVAAMRMGDMVQDNTDAQYELCVKGTDILDGSGIPWMPMRGDPDASDMFNRYFGYEKYGSGRDWFGGSYEDGKLDHTYWFVTAGEREYMILSLGYAPNQAVLDWAAEVVEANPDKSVIINAHDIVNYNGAFQDGDMKIWNALGGYPNVVLGFSGHIAMADLVKCTDTNGAGKTVYSVLVDGQSEDQGADTYWGMLALLTFDKDSNSVDVNWYSTRYDAFYGEKNQFEIEVPHVCTTHTYSDQIKVEATCTESGCDTHTCTACGDSYTETIPASGHTIVDGKCVVCGLTSPVAQNETTGVTYSSASAALKEAGSGQTVKILQDHTDGNLIVPAGVTLNLNGCVVTAKNVLSFGVVMDSQTEVGGIRIPIDTAQAFTKLQRDNGGYLPVYDTTNGMYKFFEYTLVNAGHMLEETCVAFGFKIQFTNMDAYSVLAATENSGISLTINLQWTDMTVPYVPHRITDSTIAEYGEAVATTRSISKAMVIRVSGLNNLPSGGYVSAAPVLDTIAEVTAANDPEVYTVPKA